MIKKLITALAEFWTTPVDREDHKGSINIASRAGWPEVLQAPRPDSNTARSMRWLVMEDGARVLQVCEFDEWRTVPIVTHITTRKP